MDSPIVGLNAPRTVILSLRGDLLSAEYFDAVERVFEAPLGVGAGRHLQRVEVAPSFQRRGLRVVDLRLMWRSCNSLLKSELFRF